MTADQKSIIVPTPVNPNLCYGDTENGVRFEIFPEMFHGNHPTIVTDAFNRGERVFVTDSDDLMFLKPGGFRN